RPVCAMTRPTTSAPPATPFRTTLKRPSAASVPGKAVFTPGQNVVRDYSVWRAGGQPADLVAVITTEPLEPAAGDELREDLIIMDKLLRDAVAGADLPRNALGGRA